jgi:hypothetical protein
MDLFMSDNRKMAQDKVQEKHLTLMEAIMKENGKMIKNTEMGYFNMLMEPDTMDSGKVM